jgi:hypothetical protein
MVWPRRPLPNPEKSILKTLSYSDKYDYPLTPFEIWFWQISSTFPLNKLTSWPYITAGLYHLKGRSNLVPIRKKRALNSQNKWYIAESVARLLKKIPSVQAVFITGSLSMNNCPEFDDIDMMLVTSPYTLWFTRPVTVMLLKFLKLRRDPYLPEHSSLRVNNKICDNLWLDQNHLCVPARNLYTAHEVLQAKCLFDRGGIHHQFILQNSWAKNYLYVAYKETLKQFNRPVVSNHRSNILNVILFAINYLLFTIQYLHMRPRLTREKIGLGYAFFHPDSPPV